MGQTKLNAGDIRGALDEFRRLAALHPKEAQHHIEIAKALLAGGLGDAAREEIRRAVTIEPKNARAHQVMGAILFHDSLGRPYRKGFDRKGAIAAYRKAKELDPEDYGIRAALVSALTYGDDGFRFSPTANLAEAVKEILAMPKELGDAGKAVLPELTLVYSHMGRFDELRKLAPTLDDETQRDLARIIATAALDGTDAALRELGAFDQQTKRRYASGAGATLMQLRLYPAAAAAMDLAVRGTDKAAAQRPFIDILTKLKRSEELPVDSGPRSVIGTLLSATITGDVDKLRQLVPRDMPDSESGMEEFMDLDLRPPDELPPPVFGDLLATMMDVQQEGDDDTGYRLRLRMLGMAADVDAPVMLVRREDERWVIRGSDADELTGDTVLAMAGRGELEPARKWLNWGREDAKGGTSDDPLEGLAFAALWPKSKATATAQEIRIAAASLTMPSKESEAILLAARDQVPSETARASVDLALAAMYEKQKDFPKMLAVTTRLVAAQPESPTAFSRHIDALVANSKTADAMVLAKHRLERLPKDRDAIRAQRLIASASGDYDAAQQYAVRIIDELRPENADYTTAAWLALFTGKQLDRAIEHAQHAVSPQNKSADKTGRAARTLAALYAETGRSVEARTALLETLDGSRKSALHESDWYILGRIAENYGVNDFAIAAYRKASKTNEKATSSELARKRLAVLEPVRK
ncbi:MAG TPA: tetratricopeptide repeat protein [Thermoanaerobaculia bacterium]